MYILVYALGQWGMWAREGVGCPYSQGSHYHSQTIIPPSARKDPAPLRLLPPNDRDRVIPTAPAITVSLLLTSLQ